MRRVTTRPQSRWRSTPELQKSGWERPRRVKIPTAPPDEFKDQEPASGNVPMLDPV